GEDTPTLDDEETRVAERLAKLGTEVPTVVHTMADTPDPTLALAGGGIPAYTTIELTVHALAGSARWARASPRALPPRTHSAARPAQTLSYLDARSLLRRAGVPMTAADVATSAA